MNSWRRFFDKTLHRPGFSARDLLKYVGPGLLVTVGFIDPGNWASNVAAGGGYGYALLWMVTLSTLMLIVLQHNVAHLGIATGLCLAEATRKHLPQRLALGLLSTAMIASVSTSLAEILGAAIALNMLFNLPIPFGVALSVVFSIVMILSNSYRVIERWIIAFVSIIGFSFIYELSLVHIDWKAAAWAWVTPAFPSGSMPIVMSVLGAVVMPHNLFLHSEIIQSRQWNLEDEQIIRKQLDYEFFDTLFSMGVGWAINSAMILLAATTFHIHGIEVNELQQARDMLRPLLGEHAAVIFAVALLFSGISSTITSGMAAGTIVAGFHGEPFDIRDNHSRLGVIASLVLAAAVIFWIRDPFKGLVYSQVVLSMQLPITVGLQVWLTSSEKVMGKYRNPPFTKAVLVAIGAVVTLLNIGLLISVAT